MEKAKTCEEFVLNELAEARQNVKTGAELLRKALAVLDCKNAILGIIRDKLELRTLPDGTQVIGMKPVFSNFDEEEFSVLEDFLYMGESGEDE